MSSSSITCSCRCTIILFTALIYKRYFNFCLKLCKWTKINVFPYLFCVKFIIITGKDTISFMQGIIIIIIIIIIFRQLIYTGSFQLFCM
jgi:hypothetical protein